MDERQKLTATQADILRFIQRHAEENQRMPTVREIGEAFDIHNPNGVVCHLKALEKKGYIERDRKSSRGIHIVGGKCPYCGK